tara:strand:- start:41 stop:1747 length:1707 start_codon:yes stop_codon:yes gene_type:complete
MSAETVEDFKGQIGNAELVDHSKRLNTKLWNVAEGVWCLVGNGLSNQTFVEGPEGLIIIDTGECVEEMTEALAAIREETQSPVAAIIYTHFHYVAGTEAIFTSEQRRNIPIWGHERITANRRSYGTELSAVASRGLIHQFGIALPDSGSDAVINVGLGQSYRNPDHAPFTPGFVEPNQIFAEPISTQIAGLKVEMIPAPSDADDSITIWFPELGICVNNLIWPALFNVFAIRGEEYRDPRVLLTGIDHILSLSPEIVISTHGPPIVGTDYATAEITRYRDRIQFLWDQTVRGINRGMDLEKLTQFVQLPRSDEESYLTQQFYGLAEHHVRQIHNGLRGWFDGNPAKLFPDDPSQRAEKFVTAFGGFKRTQEIANEAFESGDLRWAIELSCVLIEYHLRSEGDSAEEIERDSNFLATCLRTIAQKTTAANIRNWCLTYALELEGFLNLERHRRHRFSRSVVLANPPSSTVHALRVLLDPIQTIAYEGELRWEFDSGETTGLLIRNHVAVPTDGKNANFAISLSLETWANLLSGLLTLSDSFSSGMTTTKNTNQEITKFFSHFDLPSFTQ